MVAGYDVGANMALFWLPKTTKIASWRPLGASCGRLGASWGVSWASWRRVRAVLGRLGLSWRRLGGVLRRLGGILEASWALLETSWRRFGNERGVLATVPEDTRGAV